MPADWLVSVLASPLVERFFAAVVVFVLLGIMHMAIKALIQALNSFTAEIRADRQKHNDDMKELREGLRWLQDRWAPKR